jgi:F-type H+-transporting ATPase subunit delta
MLGSSRESLAALRRSLDSRKDEPGFGALTPDLLAVAGVLRDEKSLRLALADAGQPQSVRVGIVTSLFGGRISALSLDVLTEAVDSRWSTDADLVDAVADLGAGAAFAVADREGTLDRVETELFTFGQAVDSSADLQLALTDPSVSPERKAELVRGLVEPTASPITTTLLTFLAQNLNGRHPVTAVADLARIASEQRSQLLAEVRTAVPLTDDQHRRLVAALSALQGHDVRLNVIHDPAIIGGVIVRVGDDVIDGSVASRLEQARRGVAV